MRAIIPAEGKGTRLRPLTNSMAKTLLPVVGVPILERLLQSLHGTPVDHVIISFSMPDESISTFLRGKHYPFSIKLIEGKAESSLKSFWALASVTTAPFIMIDADLVVPIQELRAFVVAAPGLATAADLVIGITTDQPSSIQRGIWVESKIDGAITVLGRNVAPTLWRTVGSYYWTPAGVAACASHIQQGMTSLAEYLKVFSTTHVVLPFTYTGSRDVNTLGDITSAEAFIKTLGKD